MAELKNTCAPQIATYRSCLDRHASQDDEVIEARCGTLMKEVWECSERAMGVIDARVSAGVEGARLV